jgi:mRNA-degrading endonuclease toxin of MazEF toxin-antitoxin module
MVFQPEKRRKEVGGEKHMLTYPFGKACKEIFGKSGEPVYRRGQVYRVRQSQVTGSEQAGGRPAVIVSNDIGNDYSTVMEVVYLTTQKKTDLPTHVPINSVKYPSTALCEQIQTVCKDRLGGYIGTVTDQEMEGINEALLISLGLKKPHKKNKKAENPEKDGESKASGSQKPGARRQYRG